MSQIGVTNLWHRLVRMKETARREIYLTGGNPMFVFNFWLQLSFDG